MHRGACCVRNVTSMYGLQYVRPVMQRLSYDGERYCSCSRFGFSASLDVRMFEVFHISLGSLPPWNLSRYRHLLKPKRYV